MVQSGPIRLLPMQREHTELHGTRTHQEMVAFHERALIEKFSPLIGGDDLVSIAGFQTKEALRLALRRGVIGFDVFRLPGRRGLFARAHDIALWLSSFDHEKHVHSQVCALRPEEGST